METRNALLQEIEAMKANVFNYTMAEVIQRESEIRDAADAAADLMIAEARARADVRAEYSQLRGTAADEVVAEPVFLPSLLDDEIEAAPVIVEYLIKDWTPKKSDIFLYGDSGVGKSFVGIDLSMCIAHSGISSWQGSKVNHGDIVYISGEGNEGFVKRVKAWQQVYGVPDFHKLIIPMGVSIDQPAEVSKLISTIDARGVKPSLIVIDTLFRNFAGDENSARDLKLFFKGTEALRNYYQCSTLTIHHGGKDASKGMRGSSSIFGACDVVIKATKGAEGIVILETEKTKDGKGRKLELPFEEVSLDSLVDADGDSLNTLVIKHEGGTEIEIEDGESATNADNLSGKQWEALKAILTAGERHIITGEGGEAIGVDRKEAKKVFVQEAILNDPSKADKVKSEGSHFYNRVTELKKKDKLTVTDGGVISFKGPFAWLIHEYLLNASTSVNA